MHEYVVNLALVKRIWSIAEKIEVRETRNLLKDARVRSAELLNKADKDLSNFDQMDIEHIKSLTRLPDKTLSDSSTNIIKDVVTFSSDIVRIFQSVSSTRELTKEEQEIGRMLNELLTQVLAIAGKSGGTPGATVKDE